MDEMSEEFPHQEASNNASGTRIVPPKIVECTLQSLDYSSEEGEYYGGCDDNADEYSAGYSGLPVHSYGCKEETNPMDQEVSEHVKHMEMQSMSGFDEVITVDQELVDSHSNYSAGGYVDSDEDIAWEDGDEKDDDEARSLRVTDGYVDSDEDIAWEDGDDEPQTSCLVDGVDIRGMAGIDVVVTINHGEELVSGNNTSDSVIQQSQQLPRGVLLVTWINLLM